jgi:hypothetical protein
MNGVVASFSAPPAKTGGLLFAINGNSRRLFLAVSCPRVQALAR